jgi:MFS superfamily sulfate permease-like transporter
MALAIASGTSPEKGLQTAIVAGLLMSALGGSRVQIGGPTAAFIPVVFNVIEKLGFGGLLLCKPRGILAQMGLRPNAVNLQFADNFAAAVLLAGATP